MFPFDPPENIRKPLVFCCFQGDQKGTFGRKGLNVKKFLETQEVLRNAIRKNHSPPTCSQFSLITDNYFYGVRRYFVILSIEKFNDVVIY